MSNSVVYGAQNFHQPSSQTTPQILVPNMPKRGLQPSPTDDAHRHKKQRTSVPTNVTTNAPNVRAKRKGFTVGPSNLPDGTYRRKAQQIKKTLIHRAKLRKELDKIKRRDGVGTYPAQDARENTDEDDAAERARRRMEKAMESDDEEVDEASSIGEYRGETSMDPEATVTALSDLNGGSSASDDDNDDMSDATDHRVHPSRKQGARHQRLSRYTNEIKISRKAQEAKAERDRVVKARATAAEKRERERKARNKAMGDGKTARTSTGQMKLGRQSKGLLERVEKLMSKG